MPVTKHSGLPSGRGERDSQHHKHRVKKQITEHLRQHIGGEDIITGEGKVKVPVTGSRQYRFIYDRGKQSDGPTSISGGQDGGAEDYEVWLDMAEVEQILFAELELPRLKPKKEIEAEVSEYKFDTFAVKGPQVDKKSTLKRNLVRTAVQGGEGIGSFDKDDLRYISYHEKPRPKSKAVVFLAMDVSGSMGEKEKQIARLFDYWIVKFLRNRYDTVEIVFISHTTEAREVTENEFFNRKESGGTTISSAYHLIQRIQHERFPVSDWNIYVLHASDGDNWALDNKEVHACITALCRVCSLVGYLEIKRRVGHGMLAARTAPSKLIGDLQTLGSPGEEFLWVQITDEKGIWGAIKYFFAKDNVQSYTQAAA